MKTVTTPAATPISSPLRSAIKAYAGVIYRFEIMIPPGPSGLLGAKLWYADHALYPVDRDEWFIGDNVTIGFDDILALQLAENQLDLYTYNVDETYDHLVQVRIGIMPTELFEARYLPGKAISELTESMTEILDLPALRLYESDRSAIDYLTGDGGDDESAGVE